MGSKSLLKSIIIFCSLLLPSLSLWLFNYSIFHADQVLRLLGFVAGFYAFTQAIAFSVFCRKMRYRITVAVAAFLITGMCIWVFQFLTFLLVFTVLAAVSVNIFPKKWNKSAWMMLPYIVIRALIANLSIYAGWEVLFEGEYPKEAYIPLLCFTYCQIFIILIYDLIVYCVIKIVSRKKEISV